MRTILTLWLLWLTWTANATTYYIDFATGSDANNGTAKATPWKRQPYMRGFTGTYTHATGDQFIFKGGITWDNSCFTLNVLAGGIASNPDYYGTDPAWFNGGSFSRPIFDAGGIELSGGYDVMILLNLANAPHDIVFDNIDMRNLFWDGPKSFSQVAYVNLSVSSNTVVQNCFIHNWTHGPTSSGTTDILKIIIGSNSSPFNPGCMVSGCVIDGENSANSTQGMSSGEATFAYAGNIVGTIARNMASGFIVTGQPNSTVPQVISNCEVGPTYFSFDNGAHPDAIFMNGGSLFYWHDNYIHDNNTENIFCGNGNGTETTYLWNNLVYNCPTHPAVEIDNISASSGNVYMWNNTFVGGSFSAVRLLYRGNGPLNALDFRNNHVISDVGGVTLDTGASITHFTNLNNIVQSVASAAVQGYSLANLYRPTSATAPTIAAGQSLSSLFPTAFTSVAVSTNGTVAVDIGSGDPTNHFIALNDPVSGYPNLFTISSNSLTRSDQIIPNGFRSDHFDIQSNILAVVDNAPSVVNLNVRRYSFTGYPPTTLTPIDVHTVGNSDSRAGGTLLFLNSGGLLFAWSQQTAIATNAGFYFLYGVSYLPPGSSTWKDHFPIAVGPAGATGIAALINIASAQHPADGAVWLYFKRDTYHWISAMKCVESAGDVTITTFDKLIDQAVYGENGPDGELPNLVALPSPANNAIVLAYQRNHFKIFGNSPFYKGCYLALAFLDSAGTPTFVSLDKWVERISSYALGVDSAGTTIVYKPVSAGGVDPDSFVTTWNGSTWSNPQLVEPNTFFLMLTSTRRNLGAVYKANSGNVWKLLERISPLQSDILAVNRPDHLAWDSGAYQWVGTGVTPGTVALSTSATSVPQSGGFVGITVVRGGGTMGAVSVTASTADGTAVAGHDYTATSFLAQWADGTTGARSFTVPILPSGDTAITNRDFTVNLSAATGGVAIGSPSTETVTIVMPPPPPPQPTNAGTVNMLETSHAVTLTSGTASISVTRSGSTNIGTSVSYTTVDGTAIAGTDYTATSGTLTWGINENSTKLISVPITNTGKHSSTPITFTVLISNPTNGATIGAAMTSVSITLLPVLAAPTGLVITGNVDIQGPVVLKFNP